MSSRSPAPFALLRATPLSVVVGLLLALLVPLSYLLLLEPLPRPTEYLQSIWQQLVGARFGGNPYASALLGRVHWASAFVPRDPPAFHPWFFVLFTPLGLRSLQDFTQLANLIGYVSFFGLVILWCLQLGPRLSNPAFSALLGLCALQYAAFQALRLVPFMLLESLLIYCALSRFREGQARAFCMYLGLASCLSGTAILLLPLTLLMPTAKRASHAASAGACLLFYCLPALWDAPRFFEFLQSAFQVRASVSGSYSLYSIVGEYLYRHGAQQGAQMALGWSYVFVILLAASVYRLARASKHSSPQDLAQFALLSYVLLMPALQPWTLLLCLPALLTACQRWPAMAVLALIGILPSQGLLGFQAGRYGAVVCLGVIWGVVMRKLTVTHECQIS